MGTQRHKLQEAREVLADFRFGGITFRLDEQGRLVVGSTHGKRIEPEVLAIIGRLKPELEQLLSLEALAPEERRRLVFVRWAREHGRLFVERP